MFPGFTDSDFDAYARNKWRSNAFNRERLEVKQKLQALGKQLTGKLHGVDGSPLLCETSTEHPALWNQKQVVSQQLYFSRNEAARRELDAILTRSRSLASLIEDPSPQRSHVFLTVHLTLDELLVGLRLHTDATVDRQNLHKKVAEPWLRDELLATLAELHSSFIISLGDGEHGAAAELDAPRLERVLTELAKPLGPNQSRWLTIARRFDRAETLAAEQGIEGHIRDALLAVLPIYQFIAWSRDNDHISIRDQLRKQTVEKKKRGLAKNDKVRIVGGMFAGRTGIVHEINDRGVVRVLVGNMPVVVKADELDKA